MARLTIILPDALHRALKEAAAMRPMTIGDLIVESLAFYGIKPRTDVLALVRRAQESGGMDEKEALSLAIRETRTVRRRRAHSRAGRL